MRPEKTLYTHGGNVHAAARDRGGSIEGILDFSANINPLGAPQWLRSCISRELDILRHYPDPDTVNLRRIISEQYGVPEESILAANGSTELLYHLPRVLACQRAVIPVPCYIDYLKVMEISSIPVAAVPLAADNNFQVNINYLDEILEDNDLCILGSPNNPTGQCPPADDIVDLAEKKRQVTFLVDEAFLDFVEKGRSVAGAAENIITLHSLTKFYAIPGLRLGFGVLPAGLAAKLRRLLPPWSVNSLAQEVGARALLDSDYKKRSLAYCGQCRRMLAQGLRKFPELKLFPAEANFFLVRLAGKISVAELQSRLEEHAVLIRNCANYQGLDQRYFRVAVRNIDDNRHFLEALSAIMPLAGGRRKARKKSGRTPALMFQGTSSNAGKSVLAAALCRILLQDGVRVAPFKAQNMSLNSFVTHDGLEMGRAQVVQAQAARLDPDVRMNPILLKPNSDTGSQIIVLGKAVGNMAVMEYARYKKDAIKAVSRAYDELSGEYQAIILEGAGSPGEVNLKQRDIVNMRMARYARSPVILVGDIDRGGVYASFVGTMEVLDHWERSLVAGFLVNRFRGDGRLLQDAHEYVRAHTGREVIGVVPFLADLGLPEEDSVSFKAGLFQKDIPRQSHIDIAVINLPHISNFTDLEPLANEPDVHLRVISRAEEISAPDVIILPGSKNVIGDLETLFDTGIAAEIRRRAAKGCEVVGICGGYQMLGDIIDDPYGIESDKKSIRGLSLLEMRTRLAREKTLQRKEGIHLSSGQPVAGYEIHHGFTSSGGGPLFQYNDDSSCGTASADELVWGAYLHGIFDSDPFRRSFIEKIRKRKGLPPYAGPFYSYDLEPAFDRLAAVVRNALDMDRVYQLLGL